MQHLRKLALAILIVLGLWLAIDIVYREGLKFELTIGVGCFLAAVAVAGAVFQAIRLGKLPLPVWYLLPLIMGGGFFLLGKYNIRGWLTDISGFGLGIAAVMISFAVLRFWADTKGEQGWAGIALFYVAMVSTGVVGAISFYAG